MVVSVVRFKVSHTGDEVGIVDRIKPHTADDCKNGCAEHQAPSPDEACWRCDGTGQIEDEHHGITIARQCPSCRPCIEGCGLLAAPGDVYCDGCRSGVEVAREAGALR